MSSIRDDFKPYIDGNGLMAPGPVPPGTGRGSDNGTMFTSEYYIALKKNDDLELEDEFEYEQLIDKCIDANGLLNRAPVGTDSDQEGPDDYYGVANGCMEMGATSAPRRFLWALIRYFGCLNNNSPGTWTLDSFLARQPQLVCAILSAAFPSKVNPLHWIIRLLAFPLYLFSAVIIATSCIGAAYGDTDGRRLSWHLGNNVSKVSILNWLAFKIWRRRLYSTYPNGMKDVAGIYYQPHPDNPFSKWWVT